jgi:hypothetical protein
MCRRVHAGITVVAERLRFQTINFVGLAIIMNEVINRFSISQILHLTDEAILHHESTTLVAVMYNVAGVITVRD